MVKKEKTKKPKNPEDRRAAFLAERRKVAESGDFGLLQSQLDGLQELSGLGVPEPQQRAVRGALKVIREEFLSRFLDAKKDAEGEDGPKKREALDRLTTLTPALKAQYEKLFVILDGGDYPEKAIDDAEYALSRACPIARIGGSADDWDQPLNPVVAAEIGTYMQANILDVLQDGVFTENRIKEVVILPGETYEDIALKDDVLYISLIDSWKVDAVAAVEENTRFALKGQNEEAETATENEKKESEFLNFLNGYIRDEYVPAWRRREVVGAIKDGRIEAYRKFSGERYDAKGQRDLKMDESTDKILTRAEDMSVFSGRGHAILQSVHSGFSLIAPTAERTSEKGWRKGWRSNVDHFMTPPGVDHDLLTYTKEQVGRLVDKSGRDQIQRELDAQEKSRFGTNTGLSQKYTANKKPGRGQEDAVDAAKVRDRSGRSPRRDQRKVHAATATPLDISGAQRDRDRGVNKASKGLLTSSAEYDPNKITGTTPEKLFEAAYAILSLTADNDADILDEIMTEAEVDEQEAKAILGILSDPSGPAYILEVFPGDGGEVEYEIIPDEGDPAMARVNEIEVALGLASPGEGVSRLVEEVEIPNGIKSVDFLRAMEAVLRGRATKGNLDVFSKQIKKSVDVDGKQLQQILDIFTDPDSSLRILEEQGGEYAVLHRDKEDARAFWHEARDVVRERSVGTITAEQIPSGTTHTNLLAALEVVLQGGQMGKAMTEITKDDIAAETGIADDDELQVILATLSDPSTPFYVMDKTSKGYRGFYKGDGGGERFRRIESAIRVDVPDPSDTSDSADKRTVKKDDGGSATPDTSKKTPDTSTATKVEIPAGTTKEHLLLAAEEILRAGETQTFEDYETKEKVVVKTPKEKTKKEQLQKHTDLDDAEIDIILAAFLDSDGPFHMLEKDGKGDYRIIVNYGRAAQEFWMNMKTTLEGPAAPTPDTATSSPDTAASTPDTAAKTPDTPPPYGESMKKLEAAISGLHFVDPKNSEWDGTDKNMKEMLDAKAEIQRLLATANREIQRFAGSRAQLSMEMTPTHDRASLHAHPPSFEVGALYGAGPKDRLKGTIEQYTRVWKKRAKFAANLDADVVRFGNFMDVKDGLTDLDVEHFAKKPPRGEKTSSQKIQEIIVDILGEENKDLIDIVIVVGEGNTAREKQISGKKAAKPKYEIYIPLDKGWQETFGATLEEMVTNIAARHGLERVTKPMLPAERRKFQNNLAKELGVRVKFEDPDDPAWRALPCTAFRRSKERAEFHKLIQDAIAEVPLESSTDGGDGRRKRRWSEFSFRFLPTDDTPRFESETTISVGLAGKDWPDQLKAQLQEYKRRYEDRSAIVYPLRKIKKSERLVDIDNFMADEIDTDAEVALREIIKADMRTMIVDYFGSVGAITIPTGEDVYVKLGPEDAARITKITLVSPPKENVGHSRLDDDTYLLQLPLVKDWKTVFEERLDMIGSDMLGKTKHHEKIDTFEEREALFNDLEARFPIKFLERKSPNWGAADVDLSPLQHEAVLRSLEERVMQIDADTTGDDGTDTPDHNFVLTLHPDRDGVQFPDNETLQVGIIGDWYAELNKALDGYLERYKKRRENAYGADNPDSVVNIENFMDEKVTDTLLRAVGGIDMDGKVELLADEILKETYKDRITSVLMTSPTPDAVIHFEATEGTVEEEVEKVKDGVSTVVTAKKKGPKKYNVFVPLTIHWQVDLRKAIMDVRRDVETPQEMRERNFDIIRKAGDVNIAKPDSTDWNKPETNLESFADPGNVIFILGAVEERLEGLGNDYFDSVEINPTQDTSVDVRGRSLSLGIAGNWKKECTDGLDKLYTARTTEFEKSMASAYAPISLGALKEGILRGETPPIALPDVLTRSAATILKRFVVEQLGPSYLTAFNKIVITPGNNINVTEGSKMLYLGIRLLTGHATDEDLRDAIAASGELRDACNRLRIARNLELARKARKTYEKVRVEEAQDVRWREIDLEGFARQNNIRKIEKTVDEVLGQRKRDDLVEVRIFPGTSSQYEVRGGLGVIELTVDKHEVDVDTLKAALTEFKAYRPPTPDGDRRRERQRPEPVVPLDEVMENTTTPERVEQAFERVTQAIRSDLRDHMNLFRDDSDELRRLYESYRESVEFGHPDDELDLRMRQFNEQLTIIIQKMEILTRPNWWRRVAPGARNAMARNTHQIYVDAKAARSIDAAGAELRAEEQEAQENFDEADRIRDAVNDQIRRQGQLREGADRSVRNLSRDVDRRHRNQGIIASVAGGVVVGTALLIAVFAGRGEKGSTGKDVSDAAKGLQQNTPAQKTRTPDKPPETKSPVKSKGKDSKKAERKKPTESKAKTPEKKGDSRREAWNAAKSDIQKKLEERRKSIMTFASTEDKKSANFALDIASIMQRTEAFFLKQEQSLDKRTFERLLRILKIGYVPWQLRRHEIITDHEDLLLRTPNKGEMFTIDGSHYLRANVDGKEYFIYDKSKRFYNKSSGEVQHEDVSNPGAGRVKTEIHLDTDDVTPIVTSDAEITGGGTDHASR